MTKSHGKEDSLPTLKSALASFHKIFSNEVKEDLYRLAARLGVEPFADRFRQRSG
jgi:hypothetical protein